MIGKIVTWGVLVAIVALIGIALFRPATLFGVDAKALGNSLGGEVHHSQALCVDEGSGRWRCALQGSNVKGVEYVLTTHQFGCWSGSRVALPSSASPVEQSVSGCIGLADMFGN